VRPPLPLQRVGGHLKATAARVESLYAYTVIGEGVRCGQPQKVPLGGGFSHTWVKLLED
jgi:hypothetical protein